MQCLYILCSIQALGEQSPYRFCLQYVLLKAQTTTEREWERNAVKQLVSKETDLLAYSLLRVHHAQIQCNSKFCFLFSFLLCSNSDSCCCCCCCCSDLRARFLYHLPHELLLFYFIVCARLSHCSHLERKTKIQNGSCAQQQLRWGSARIHAMPVQCHIQVYTMLYINGSERGTYFCFAFLKIFICLL